MSEPKSKVQIIKETYENKDFGYGGINETYKKAHAVDPTIRRIDVKNYLDKLSHRQTQVNPKAKGQNSFVSPRPLFEFEIDLIDMTAVAEDNDGFAIFRKFCENVVLFTGTHRFLDQDLPQLLEHMRIPGGKKLPADLKQRVQDRIQAGAHDPRLSKQYVQEQSEGFFAYGAHIAIQWEQVARLQQLHVLAAAEVSRGPQAFMNLPTGKPHFHERVDGNQVAGQLVYYFQSACLISEIAPDTLVHTCRAPISYRLQVLKISNPSRRCKMIILERST